MMLAGLESRQGFALLGPGFGDGDSMLLTELRPIDRDEYQTASERRRPTLVYAPYDTKGSEPRLYSGERATAALELKSGLESPQLDCELQINLDTNAVAGGYQAAIEQLRASIAAGDVYQVNYALRAALGPASGSAIARALCRRGIPEWFAWIRFPEGDEFVSGSPEKFFSIEGSKVSCEPMKGTAPPDQEGWLSASEKDRAELSMITDLMRNDLTPVCAPGSIRVVRERRFIRLPYAIQTVSDIEGDLLPESGALEVLAALHPCGSVTGAPKRAAMKAIAKLEPEPRGAYCGSLGLVTREGEIDRARFSVLIRTAQRRSNGWSYGVGGGIVWQSNAESELRELQLKLGALR